MKRSERPHPTPATHSHGWKQVRIRDVVIPFKTVDPTKRPNVKFTYIDIGAIDNRSQTINEPKQILGKDAPSRARRQIKAGDVLFSTVRTYLKNIAVVPNDLDGAVTSTGISVLRPSDEIESRFLFNWVRSPEFLTKIGTAMDGTMYPAVTDTDVLDEFIPLPPRSVQRSVVAKLDRLFQHSRRAREELLRIPRLIHRYKQATLAAAFRGDLTSEWRNTHGVSLHSEWQETTLRAVAIDVRYGTAAKCHYAPKATPVLRIPNVANGRIDVADLKYGSFSKDELKKLALRSGDLLTVRSNGSLDLVGRSALVTEAVSGYLFAGYLIRIRLDSEKMDPAFVQFAFEEPSIRQTIERLAKSTSGVNNINSEQLKSLKFPQPCLQEQKEIVARIHATFARIEQMAIDADCALRLLDRLDQATLAKAFRSELKFGGTSV